MSIGATDTWSKYLFKVNKNTRTQCNVERYLPTEFIFRDTDS